MIAHVLHDEGKTARATIRLRQDGGCGCGASRTVAGSRAWCTSTHGITEGLASKHPFHWMLQGADLSVAAISAARS